MDQESLQRWVNGRIFSDRTSKMEVQSKQGPMVGWAVRKDDGAMLINQCLYLAAGKAKLTKQELEEVILDAEVNLNNRPLVYIDVVIQFLVLTPNILIQGKPIAIPDEQFDDDDKVIKKRQRHIKHCKDAAWNRCNKEYCVLLEKDTI